MSSTGPDDQSNAQSSGFKLLFEHTSDCIVEGSIQDGEPVVHRVNDAFESVFGYTNSELRGENLDDFITPDGKRDEVEAVDQVIREGDIGPREVTRQTADGPRDFLFRATGGEGELSYAIYTDITARKERERQLQQERDRLDEFASIVSHDLRNPLNVAELRLDLAREECNSEHLAVVEPAHDRMQALIEDLLKLARIGEAVTDVEPVTLPNLIEGCWQHIEGYDATVRVETDLTVQADKSRLQQLLENLLQNSVEHGGDDVTITIGNLNDGFYIADDGPGIPADEREQVFESGYSTADEGTGFGLNIVKEIAEAHNWQIRITGSKHGGARIEVTGIEVVE